MAVGPIADGLYVPLAQPEGPLELGSLRAPQEPEAGAGAAFGEILEGMLLNANQTAVAATRAGEEFAAGRRDDVHGTMLALSKADVELRLVGSVRNKLIDAFYEVWRMSV